MSIDIIIPITLRQYSEGQPLVKTEAQNLKSALMGLARACPRMKTCVLDPQGRPLAGVEIAVNNREILPWDLEQPLMSGDQVRISTVITGG